MKLVIPMYNVHPSFSLKNLGKNVCIIHGKICYVILFTLIQIVCGTYNTFNLPCLKSIQSALTFFIGSV